MSKDGLVRSVTVKPHKRQDSSVTERERDRPIHELILLQAAPKILDNNTLKSPDAGSATGGNEEEPVKMAAPQPRSIFSHSSPPLTIGPKKIAKHRVSPGGHTFLKPVSSIQKDLEEEEAEEDLAEMQLRLQTLESNLRRTYTSEWRRK